MNTFRSVWTALANLASAINGLAAVINDGSAKLRERLMLDGEPETPALSHNGEAMEQAGAGKRRK